MRLPTYTPRYSDTQLQSSLSERLTKGWTTTRRTLTTPTCRLIIGGGVREECMFIQASACSLSSALSATGPGIALPHLREPFHHSHASTKLFSLLYVSCVCYSPLSFISISPPPHTHTRSSALLHFWSQLSLSLYFHPSTPFRPYL